MMAGPPGQTSAGGGSLTIESRSEAPCRANIAFGEHRMDHLIQELRHAIRSLIRKPGFALAAVITLAIGIGLNSAIFSVVNSIILQPLPYRDPDRLVQIWERDRREGSEDSVVSPADFVDWQKQAQSFESISAYRIWRPELAGANGTVQLAGALVSNNFFETLGVTPLLGRTFAPEEGQPDKGRVVVVSYNFWQSRLGGRPDVIGQTLTINENPYIMIGVLRPDYRHPEPKWDQTAELWRPLALREGAERGSRYLRAIGRLRQGATRQQAQAEMTAIASRLEQAWPATNTNVGVSIVPLHKQYTGNVRLALLVLQGAVAFVLMIACVNIANLLLARLAVREKEIAVRSALGAGKARLIRLLLTESMMLAITGGVVGLMLAYQGVNLLSSFAPRDLTRLSDIKLDGQVLIFTTALSLLTMLFFGAAPALHAVRTNINEALKGGRGAARGQGLRKYLVVAEIALALVLLVGAGLMLRSLIHLQSVRLGFNSDNLLTMQIGVPRSIEDHQIASYYQQLLARLEALPGVHSAAITSSLPMGGLNNTLTQVSIDGRPAPNLGKTSMAAYRPISPNFFRTMGVPIIKGRIFTERDIKDSTQVVIINETFAHRYLTGADPIGQKITPGFGQKGPREIVGVVLDFRHEGLEIAAEPEMYIPHAQDAWDIMALVVRTEGKPESSVAAIQNAIWSAEKNASLAQVRTMEQILYDLVSRPRFNLLLLSIFSIVALILAAIGVYGVMSYTVAQSTREIGIRMALGAQAREVLRLIIRQGMVLTLIGIVIGSATAFGLTRLMSSLLYGVSANDPLTFAGVTLLLAGVALLACYLPARRAAKIDPMVALRDE